MNNIEQLKEKHLKAIDISEEYNSNYKHLMVNKNNAASNCAKVSIDFAINVLKSLITYKIDIQYKINELEQLKINHNYTNSSSNHINFYSNYF